MVEIGRVGFTDEFNDFSQEGVVVSLDRSNIIGDGPLSLIVRECDLES